MQVSNAWSTFNVKFNDCRLYFQLQVSIEISHTYHYNVRAISLFLIDYSQVFLSRIFFELLFRIIDTTTIIIYILYDDNIIMILAYMYIFSAVF